MNRTDVENYSTHRTERTESDREEWRRRTSLFTLSKRMNWMSEMSRCSIILVFVLNKQNNGRIEYIRENDKKNQRLKCLVFFFENNGDEFDRRWETASRQWRGNLTDHICFSHCVPVSRSLCVCFARWSRMIEKVSYARFAYFLWHPARQHISRHN